MKLIDWACAFALATLPWFVVEAMGWDEFIEDTLNIRK